MKAVTPPSFLDHVHLPDHWPAQADLLDWCQHMHPGIAVLLIVAGIVYLVFGWSIYKWLVAANAALIGAYIGAIVGRASGSLVAGAIVGGFTAGAVAWPFMKWAVAIMGGLYGTLLGASIWRSAGLDAGFTWSGAMMGLILFGMLSFILFRGSVILYMSLQGAVMLIFGVLGLLYTSPGLRQGLIDGFTLRPSILPLAIFIPAILGLLYQQTHYPAEVVKK